MTDRPQYTPTSAESQRVRRPVAGRCVWEVTAGIIPGQVDVRHTKQFGLTAAEWNDDQGYALFLERQAMADAYARYLQELCAMGREVNWTHVDFVWF